MTRRFCIRSLSCAFRAGSGAIQLTYPVLMFVTLWRTISVRVRSDAVLVFTPAAREQESDSRPSMLSRFRESWREDFSLFTWANRGRWETAQASDGRTQREGDWFRIGFEPVFVDYTKRGVWFLLVQLVEVRVGWACLSCGRFPDV